ncbi:MAG: hypothetical protein PHX07_06730 [Candidatus Marinimicrobia bacterium]|jgi:tetratricopeptide (TPR) repeat protein|nr:hypothetical protein [Candidatus Neomarinimicrobiota bacterium]
MNKDHEKMMADLHRMLESQDFKSEKDMKKFLDGILGKPIPSMPAEALTPEERAQDLVFEAYDLEFPEGKEKIKEALDLDPDCIEAYEYLGSAESSPEIAMVFFEKGISIGEKKFEGKHLKENIGHFWGLRETRPYMRCLQFQSECLYAIGKTEECIRILEKMIKLNPNDNQGIRGRLMLYLIEAGQYEKYVKYDTQFKGEKSAFSLFNSALYAYKTGGICASSNKKLREATKFNKFVLPKLLNREFPTGLPDHYGLGDENEAIIYLFYAYPIWYSTKGAIEWLKNQKNSSSFPG